MQKYVSFIDLAVKCCDNSTSWNENNCFSMTKCSLTPVELLIYIFFKL